MLEISAEPLRGRTGGLDLTAFGDRVTIAVDQLGEHVAIAAEGRHLRLDVIDGTFLDGPVMPRFRLLGLAELPPKLAALHTLLRLLGIRDPKLRSIEPDRRLPRLIDALRVRDGLAAGASLREIAIALLGATDGADWQGNGEHVKSRVRRLVALARRLERLGPRGVMDNLA